MTKILRVTENEDGWSDWFYPICEPVYRMVCCDCGLSHNMQFKIMEKNRIAFRARRNTRSTSAIRRYQKHEGK